MADGITITPAVTLPGLELPVIPNIERTRRVLRRFFSREKIEVVHVQTEFGLAHAAADVAAELGIPVVHTVHTFYWASDGSWHAPLEPVIRFLLRRATGARLGRLELTDRPVDNLLRNLTFSMAARADVVVSPSAHQARDLEAAGLTRAVRIIPNPMATSHRPPVPVPGGAPRFLWVARCESVKRPLPFAEAVIAALGRTRRPFSVDFVGDGTERAALQALVAGRPEIRLHGALANGEVMKLMDRASAVVLTSVGFDNQPMTIAEAVSRHRGILYCDPKLREGLLHAGRLATDPGPGGLADAIVDLVDHPEQFAELSRGAARDGAQFSAGRFADLMTEVYDDVIGQLAR